VNRALPGQARAARRRQPVAGRGLVGGAAGASKSLSGWFRMYKIGLTGGIGSGKTRVADMLAEWGAALVDTDAIAHDLTAPGGEAMPDIVATFGAQAATAEGALNRPWMRDLVFREPAARV